VISAVSLCCLRSNAPTYAGSTMIFSEANHT
jgi:hypothetical protein